MTERTFRTPESYIAERITRDMLFDFLRSRGFSDIRDERKSYGKTQSQTLHAATRDGERLAMRVHLCWRRGPGESEKTSSAAQLLAKIKNNNWEGTLRAKIERERSQGATHLLIVQRELDHVVFAALVPISALVDIWCSQRDISESLIAQGRFGRRRRKNHAMNGSSPTIWLRDDRAPEVASALWDHPGVQDLARLPVTSIETLHAESNDTFDDMPIPDYSLFGSDAATPVFNIRSNVKRDPRVRAAVLIRAGRWSPSGDKALKDGRIREEERMRA